MRRIALMIALCPALACADDWQELRGAAIRSALEDRTLIYDSGALQDFRSSGRTLYNAGMDSWGYWRVQDDQYCSMWPPSDLWACYRVSVVLGRVRFTDATGESTEGTYAN